ncbi:hypothetical protein N658DRAFT_94159 [Parathielavia hyrcaniae]|uniref:Uncharacterized protein n=1 Tax=Parathielavia hyrcaniae TaxID=113614 RepID=A0AAN6Q4G8_9PEZI|nr:hypothetical protein N658DRAFT_94159 [Parathielavia hyrcaniae]
METARSSMGEGVFGSNRIAGGRGGGGKFETPPRLGVDKRLLKEAESAQKPSGRGSKCNPSFSGMLSRTAPVGQWSRLQARHQRAKSGDRPADSGGGGGCRKAKEGMGFLAFQHGNLAGPSFPGQSPQPLGATLPTSHPRTGYSASSGWSVDPALSRHWQKRIPHGEPSRFCSERAQVVCDAGQFIKARKTLKGRDAAINVIESRCRSLRFRDRFAGSPVSQLETSKLKVSTADNPIMLAPNLMLISTYTVGLELVCRHVWARVRRVRLGARFAVALKIGLDAGGDVEAELEDVWVVLVLCC